MPNDQHVEYLHHVIFELKDELKHKEEVHDNRLKSVYASYQRKEEIEAELRKNNPALQEAWDRYQVLLTLSRK